MAKTVSRQEVSSQGEEQTSGKSSRRIKLKAATTKERRTDRQTRNGLFPVVGIGASAGGLEAFTQLLEHLPPDTGMAFVLIQHLDPAHQSLLTSLLARVTRMPVSEITHGMSVEPDHVYVIPPNVNMAITEGMLQLQPRQKASGQHLPIDYFLRSLAEERSSRAIGVILSGTASDGTLGLEAIKTEGGIAFAQDPQSAKYDSMPRSAVAAGCVDFVLTPENIAKEIARISRHPYVASAEVAQVAQPVEAEAQPPDKNGFDRILLLLQKSTGVDFSLYKSNTLHRRIMRRAVLNKLEGLEDYARYLGEDAAEVTNLYQDILINVTKFFRHPETFVVLKEKIFPRMIEQRTSDEPVRIWVLGCSTGEEAYSIAISFSEFAGEQIDHLPVQIFATDLNETGIVKARAGLYPKNIKHDVSPERLRRFFTEADGGYQISKPLRDMCVFARQNVIADPPFSRMDLISCRNLLIYLDPVLQKQVMPLLHYALQPTGFLWLGSSESTGSSANLFLPVDKKHRFYSKKPAPARHFFSFPNRNHMQSKIDSAPKTASGAVNSAAINSANGGYDVRREADRFMLERYAPASIVINEEMEVLQLRGDTAPYLEQSTSKPTRNLLKLAREGLLVELRASIHQAQQGESSITRENLRIKYDGEFRNVNLEVIPLNHHPAREPHYLVLFETAAPETDGTGGSKQKAVGSKQKAEGGRQESEEHRVPRLKQELAAARAHLQSVVEEHEMVIEELQSASEEVQSSNEEFQSINEEMETAKEELESSNEELTSLNQELQNRNIELGWLNSDLTNLLSSVQMPILMLNNDLRIRRFTPTAEKVLNLIATDVGRPISDIKSNINVPDLEQLIEAAIGTVSVFEREVQDRKGHWFSLQVRPYKTLENKVDGAVLVLVDIDALKQSEAQIRESRDYAQNIIATVREPLIILDGDLRVQTACRTFYETFNVTPEETENRLIYDVGNGQWNIPELRTLLEDILPAQNQFKDFEVEHEFERIGRKVMLLSASEIRQDADRKRLILLTIKDITERKRAQEQMRTSELRYRRLFESARDGILILDNVARKITDVNPFMTELLGYSRDEFLGKELWEIGLMKDAEASHDAFRELQEKGYIRYEDLPLETKEGKCREVEFVSNVYAENGHQVIQCNIRDITERKRIEKERDRFFTLSMDMLCIANLDGFFQRVNPAFERLLGYPAKEFLLSPISTFLHPADQSVLMAEYASLATGRPTTNLENRWRCKDGSYKWVAWSYFPVVEEGIAYGVGRDITERKAAEEIIRQRDKLLQGIFDSVSSEMAVVDANGFITHVSKSWGRFAQENGFGMNSIGVGMNYFAVCGQAPEEDQSARAACEGIHAVVEGMQPDFRLEYACHSPSEQRWFVMQVDPMSSDDRGAVVTHTDISERKRSEEAIRQSEERFRLLVEGVRDYAIFMLDLEGHIVSWNPGVRRILGYDEAEFTGQPVSIIFTFEDIKQNVPEQELKTAAAEGRAEVEGWRVRRDGTQFWSSGVVEPLHDERGGLRGFSKVMRDITERRAAEERITHDAFHDSLTGLPNRALFVEHLKRAIAYTVRYEKYLFAVLFVDLDRFKSINDSLGHVVGDHLLIATARKLETTLRPEDVVARLGGDEFTILLNDIHSIGDATRVANRIHDELRLPFNLDGHDVSTTASIGIALSTHGYSETEEILRDADTAMYRAKTLGGGRHEIFDPSMHASVMAQLKLEADLKLAVEREEFCIHYQPIVSLENNRIAGFEALVRWQHPERGLVLPDDFIPLAEETGLIMPIGKWVLHEACRQASQWQQQLRPDLSLSINVNISGKQFSQPDLIEQIESALEQTGLAARSLKLEITESAVMEKAEAATEMLGQLRDLGVKLHIDDFGTGYSSLSNLHHFPVDVLKIDRSFVGRMGIGNENSEIVQTIVQLAHSLGMEVTAEGVETYQQLAQLKKLTCEYGQGYFFSKPVDSTRAQALLAT